MLTQVSKKFISFFCVSLMVVLIGCEVTDENLQGSLRGADSTDEYNRDIQYLNEVVSSLNEIGEFVYEDHDHIALYLDVENPDLDNFQLFCNTCRGCDIVKSTRIEQIQESLDSTRPEGEYKDIQFALNTHFEKVNQFYATYDELMRYFESKGYENDENRYLKQAVNELNVVYASITNKDSEIIDLVGGYQKQIRERLRENVNDPWDKQALYMEDNTDLVIDIVETYYNDWRDVDSIKLKVDKLDKFISSLHEELGYLDFEEKEFEYHVFENNYCKYTYEFVEEMNNYLDALRAGAVTEENISEYDTRINQKYDLIIESHNTLTELQTNVFFEPILY